MALFCPVSGLKVHTDPEWIDYQASDALSANFRIINDAVIYSLPEGYADLEGVQQSLALNDKVARFLSEGDGGYVQIEDYALLTGSSRAARKCFIDRMNNTEDLSSLIFCNLSQPSSIAVKIGSRFNTAGKPIHVAGHYEDALKLALELCPRKGQKSDMAPIDLCRCQDTRSCSLAPVDLLCDDAWNIETPEYTNDVVVVDKCILHSISKGFLHSKHVPLIDRMRHLCRSAVSEDSGLDYIVVDAGSLKGGSRSARSRYMQSLKNWHQHFPFKMYIVYGANAFMKTALHLARPIMPFRVKIAGDMDHAFQIIRDDGSERVSKKQSTGERAKAAVVKHADIEKFVALIGGLDWEREGIDSSFDMAEDHPFYYPFQSIKLIKEEFDDLLQERNKADEAIRESEKRFRQIYENIAVGVARVSLAFRIENANNAYCSMLGYREDELIGKHLKEITHPEVVEENLQKQADLAAGKINYYRMEKRFIHRDGHVVYGILDANLVRDTDGAPLYILGSVIDITQRKLAEEALRQSEERHKDISFLSSDYFYALDVDPSGRMRIDWVSDSFGRVTGYSQDEIQNFDKWMSHIHPEDLPGLEKSIALLLSNHSVKGQYRLIVKDGRVRWFADRLRPKWSHEKNRVVKVYGAVRDITKRKIAEKEKEKLQSQLYQTRKFEAIGTLAGGIAHQFNNALYAITGNIDLLEGTFPGNGKIAAYAEGMKASAHRMARLTAKLLAYARGGKYKVKTVLFCDFVKEAMPLVTPALDCALDLKTASTGDMLSVNVDPTQMQMVLSVVLTNASEAMAGRSWPINVACRHVAITDENIKDFPKRKPGNYACLTIADSGRGMDEDTRKRIFEPFFTTKFEGRGLGMAAAYGIVRNHDGWISVDSEPDKGTVVKIYLPATETPVKNDVQPEPSAQWIKGTGTILVIDDDADVMKVNRAMLEWLGYRVLEAGTGKKAIDVVNTFDGEIDLAMLDILLPDMMGNAIYPFLKKARPDLKVLVFSGYSIDGPAREILNAGAEDFIQKPFTMADISEKLKKILTGK